MIFTLTQEKNSFSLWYLTLIDYNRILDYYYIDFKFADIHAKILERSRFLTTEIEKPRFSFLSEEILIQLIINIFLISL